MVNDMSNAYNTDGLLTIPTTGGFIDNAFESIECAIAFDVRCWSDERRTAWVQAIVCGFDDEDDTWIANRYHWDEGDIARLKLMHGQWVKAKEWIERERGE